MFENIQVLVLPDKTVSSLELDELAHTLGCPLPLDYRAFLMRFGAGVLDGEIRIYSPSDVLRGTRYIRDILGPRKNDELPGLVSQTHGVSEEEGHLRLFTRYENAADFFTPQDLGHFVYIGDTMENDHFVLLPDLSPRFFEFPRYENIIHSAGSTMEGFIDYLDPRTRYAPRARRIVENSHAREISGGPDGTPYLPSFLPQGCVLPQTPDMVEEAVVWGHDDDGLVNTSISRVDIGFRPTAIAFHMAYYPLLHLLEEMALRDPTLRFEALENDAPAANLGVPCFEAKLRVDSGRGGLTLYVTVPSRHRIALYQWLASETESLGYPIPSDLQAFL